MTFSRDIDELINRVRDFKIREMMQLGEFMKLKGVSSDDKDLFTVVKQYATKSEIHYDEVCGALDRIQCMDIYD